MKPVLVAKSKKALSFFGDSPPSLIAPEEFEKLATRFNQDSIYYIDAESYSKKKLKELLTLLSETKNCAWAVLDPGNSISDPGALFLDGAVDFLSPSVLDEGISNERIIKASTLFLGEHLEETGQINAFPGWENLVKGNEYPFIFLYIDMPDAESIKKTLGEKRFAKLKDDFVKGIGYELQGAEGIVWMSDGHSLLALFPEEKASMAASASLQMILGNPLFTYEKLGLSTPAKFRFAMHRGTTIWQKPGQTGNIISRDVNFIYHLGRKFAKPAALYLSEGAAAAVSDTIRSFLKETGEFEGVAISRSRYFLTGKK